MTRYEDRKRVKSTNNSAGKSVCQKTLLLTLDIGLKQLKSTGKHMKVMGAVPKVHALTGDKPSIALSFAQTKNIIQCNLHTVHLFANFNVKVVFRLEEEPLHSGTLHCTP